MTITVDERLERNAKRSLATVFEPRHVAVIGASRTPGKHGHTVVRNLLNWGYGGRIFPVNPSGEEIEGLACYRAIGDVPEPPDCAFLVIPASAALDAVRQCADAGVRSIVIAATGFAETGTEKGRQRQAEIAAIARDSGMRIVGPNTNGFLNAAHRLSLGYNASHGEVAPAGSISIASHSGALFNSIARRLTAFGTDLGKFVSIGNEADINILDVLEYLIDDDTTRVIGLLIEGLPDGARFRALAERARAQAKPIVALKLGRSSAGAGSSLAHSSRLAGKARAYDALFAACGVASVHSLEALTGGCTLLSRFNPADAAGDQSLICVATSGAGGTLSVDFASARHVPLAGDAAGAWQEPVASALAAIPDVGPLRNPIDSSSLHGDRSRLLPVLRALSAHGYNGPIAVFSHVGARPNQDEKMARALIARQQETPAPIVVAAPGRLPPEIEALYAEAGIPLFHDMGSGFDSLACYYAALRGASGNPGATDFQPFSSGADTAIRHTLNRTESAVLSELDSSAILRLAGIPMVASRPVASAVEATKAAAELGYPVVLKALPAGIAHKDRLGLVRTGIGDAAGLVAEFDVLAQTAARHGFARRDLRFILQPMVASRIELLAGVSWEPALGHFLVFGLGGVHTELLDQVDLLPIPMDTDTLRQNITRSIVGRILDGRSDSGTTLDQFISILDGLQGLITAFGDRIESIDINPILLGADGCVGVDALIVRKLGADTTTR